VDRFCKRRIQACDAALFAASQALAQYSGEAKSWLISVPYRPEDAVKHVSQDLISVAIPPAAVKTVLVSALESLLEIVPIIRLADIAFVTLVARPVHIVTSPVQTPAAVTVCLTGPIARYIPAAHRLAQETGPSLVGTVVSVIYPILSGFQDNYLGAARVCSAKEYHETQNTENS
jgi:hypothetical protein